MIFGYTDCALAEQRSLREVLDAYLQQGTQILYSTDLVRADMRITSEPPQSASVDWLQHELTSHGLTLRQVAEDTYAITRDGSMVRSEQEPLAIVAGVVREQSTGKPVADAVVQLNGDAYRVRTSATGDFLIQGVVPGLYAATVRAPGFSPHREANFVVDQFGALNVELNRMPSILSDVTVSTSRYSLLRDQITQPMHLSMTDIELAPNPGDDPLRTVNRLPGATSNGVSAQAHIRGGAEDETLVLLDGLELYDPFHLKDFQRVFSAIHPGVIDSINLYTGGFPSQYGNHLSGVMEIDTFRPDVRRLTEISASVFNESFRSAGLFESGRGEWLIAARRGNLDLISDMSASDFGSPRYHDALGQVWYSLNDTFDVSLNMLVSEDSISLNNSEGTEGAGADYTDQYIWLTLDIDLSARLQSRIWVSHVRLTSLRDGFIDEPDSNIASVTDERFFDLDGIKSEWMFAGGDRWILTWGAEASKVSGRYDYKSNAEFIDFLDIPGTLPPPNHNLQAQPQGSQWSAFVGGKFQFTEALSTDMGLRWDRQTYVGRADEQLSPRIAFLYEIGPSDLIRASWGRFYQPQGIYELQVQDGIAEFFEPQQATHAIIGYEHQFPEGHSLRVEAYRKHINNVRPQFENVFDPLDLLPELEPDRVRVDVDRADILGLEITLSGQQYQPISWWASYAWASAEDVIMGESVPRSWDQTHALGFGLNWDRDPWNFSFAGTYHTGWPTTPLMLEEVEQPDGTVEFQPMLGPRNSERFDDFTRLDFRVGRSFELSSGTLTAFLEATNIFNATNGCCIDYEIDDVDPEMPVLVRDVSNWLPMIPSVGIIWQRAN